ncbi:MAG: zinc-binding alcohol dehydrogenase [Treponema sp.]|jgi:2-desacetyl-2-hydroxyethyl bacteriochlorophyllide A dehydrogenase|nr:zinc-binding alcohol dehydrogenase [Treponema sp.]
MPKTMKELFFTGKFTVSAREVEIPGDLSPSQILVKNEYSMLSPGTELALFTGTHVGFTDPEITWCRYPIKAGYSSVGVVSAAGEEASFAVGDRVLHYQPHADYSVVDAAKDIIRPLPPDLPDRKLALFARFGQIAFTALPASQNFGAVLIFGGGLIGNLCAQLFQTRTGRQVILADISEARIKTAEKCGVKYRINSSKENLKEALFRITEGRGVDTVVEATGVPGMVLESLEQVNRYGEVILLGSTRGKVEVDVYKLIHRKVTSLIGVHELRYPLFPQGDSKNNHQDFSDQVLKGLCSGSINAEPFITDIIPYTQVQEAYNWLLNDRDNHLGIIIDWKGV